MGFCKYCNKWVIQPKGRREKEFCNNTCRSNYWYNNNRVTKPSLNPRIPINIYVKESDIKNFGNTDKMKEKLYRFISSFEEEISIQDLTKLTNEIKPFEQPKSNYAISVPPKENNSIESRYDAYMIEIKQSRTIDEINEIMIRVRGDIELLWQQKNNLEKTAQFHSKDFYND